jgi:FixJ family two-component response regulator
MEYQDYEKLYQQAIEKNVRHVADKATEREWMLLSEVMKDMMVKQLRQELDLVS